MGTLLSLLQQFASQQALPTFEVQQGRVHGFAICTLLFIQILGRHMFEPTSADHWPAFQGANEAAVEQIETSKATLSRARPSSSKAGALFTK